MPDTRSSLQTKLDLGQRLVMWHMLSGVLPLYLVTEYPKSGGTWVGQMLGAYFELPFPRNQRPPLRSCIMHGHHLYSPLFKNVFCVIRDGRDVMVSLYYHSLFQNDRNSPRGVNKMRRILSFEDYNDIQTNLPRFIEYRFTEGARHPFFFRWDEFVESWLDKPVPLIRYEDLLCNAASVLGQAIQTVLAVEPDMQKLRRIEKEFTFQKLAGREPGSEDVGSFLRKGISGDWRNSFSKEACEVFDAYAGDMLIRLGYEKDHRWIAKKSRLSTREVVHSQESPQ